MLEFPTEAFEKLESNSSVLSFYIELKVAWIACKFFFLIRKKKAICESAAHPSGNRRTQLTFGFVVSTHQQKKYIFCSL